MLVIAAQEGVARDLLLEGAATPVAVLQARLVDRLRTRVHMTPEAARWAVEAWASALRIEAPAAAPPPDPLPLLAPSVAVPAPAAPSLPPARPRAPSPPAGRPKRKRSWGSGPRPSPWARAPRFLRRKPRSRPSGAPAGPRRGRRGLWLGALGLASVGAWFLVLPWGRPDDAERATEALASVRRTSRAGVAAFLDGWADAVGDAVDRSTGFPARVRRRADGMQMVLIPAGTFDMGAVEGDAFARDDERTRHRVTLSRAYYLDEHEVTAGMWRAHVRATRGAMRPPWDAEPDEVPVWGVSWEEIEGYLRWAGVTLPTEAQWERAARGGRAGVVYPWGDADDVGRRNGAGDEDGHAGLAPVKSFPPNDYGLFDMIGNAGEVCDDLHAARAFAAGSPSRAERLRAMESLEGRVIRGGDCRSPEDDLRTSARRTAEGYAQRPLGGLRCARSLP